MRMGSGEIKRKRGLHRPLLLCAFSSCLLFGLGRSHAQAPAAPAASPYWSAFFQEALDFSGLDVRDKNNRPVKLRGVRKALKEIFQNSVFNLLVSEDISLLATARKYLEEKVIPTCAKLRGKIDFLIQTVEMAILFAFRRVVDSVNNLWITAPPGWMAVFVFLPFFLPLLTAYRLPLTAPLRC